MGVNLKTEAAKLEAAMGGDYSGPAKNLLYQKFQARAYKVTIAAGRLPGEDAVVERVRVQREPQPPQRTGAVMGRLAVLGHLPPGVPRPAPLANHARAPHQVAAVAAASACWP